MASGPAPGMQESMDFNDSMVSQPSSTNVALAVSLEPEAVEDIGTGLSGSGAPPKAKAKDPPSFDPLSTDSAS